MCYLPQVAAKALHFPAPKDTSSTTRDLSTAGANDEEELHFSFDEELEAAMGNKRNTKWSIALGMHTLYTLD